MKSRFSKYLSPDQWLITEEGWNPSELGATETNFTLGNGYLGSRGIYEEIPDGTEQGTYIAGVYDQAGAMVTELVNAPNPIDFRIIVEGEKVDMSKMNVLENKRILDMKKGILLRRTVFSDTRKRRFLYESMRFMSLNDNHVGGMQVYFTALDKPAKIIVQDTIDDSVTNIGGLLEGRKRHTLLVDVSTLRDMNYLCVKTFARKVWIAYTSFLAVQRGFGQGVGTLNKIFNMSVGKNETVCFTKIFTLYTSKHISHRRLKKITIKDARRAIKMGFDTLLARHIEAWEKKWKEIDIKIDQDKDVEKALRFNMYHMVIAGKERDENVSISARTLSGHGYRGHIFWDTEIFLLPFFIYTNPRLAQNLLMYRYNRLNPARDIAAEKGFKGVLFPWESADDGRETTPPYAKNMDGSIIEIKTMDMEHHIVSDVAYGTWHYFAATNDIAFMLRSGLEIMFETARFWASRVTRDKRTKLYHIKKVIGPDEFHDAVNNNVYTNKMAKWNLRKAKEFYEYFQKAFPRHFRKIERRISLKKGEIETWEHIADNIKILYSESKGIFEEFEGYFNKKDIHLKTFNNYFMPVIPEDVDIGDIQKTQLVKQADVVMLLYLLPEDFTEEEKRKNYSYYVKRTLHKSSLSPSIHSILASEVGDTTRAYLFFLFSLYADLKNTHGNTAEGAHAASLGGTWQAAIMGFAGFRIIDSIPSFEPKLPGHWKSMKFCLKWKTYMLDIWVSNKKIKIFVRAHRQKGYLMLKCFSSVHKLLFNKEYVIDK